MPADSCATTPAAESTQLRRSCGPATCMPAPDRGVPMQEAFGTGITTVRSR
jgi:hypothetical protein